MTMKSYVTSFSSPPSDYAHVMVTERSGEEKDSRIYRISVNMFSLLVKYLDDGAIAKEIRS
jgi:hypothetical protein